MVNVQDASEFPCQVLNRDVWSNAAVKTIIKEYFVFWQVLAVCINYIIITLYYDGLVYDNLIKNWQEDATQN